MSCPWYCMWVDRVVGLMLSSTYAASRPSQFLKPRYKHNPSAQMPGRGTQHKQDWRKCLCSSFNKTGLIKFTVGEWKLQRYRDMLQGEALCVTCEETCTKVNGWKWRSCSPHKNKQTLGCICMRCMRQELVQDSHSHSRRHRCHVALFCFPNGYPLSHLSEVWDTEPHAIFRHQKTGLVIACETESVTA